MTTFELVYSNLTRTQSPVNLGYTSENTSENVSHVHVPTLRWSSMTTFEIVYSVQSHKNTITTFKIVYSNLTRTQSPVNLATLLRTLLRMSVTYMYVLYCCIYRSYLC